MFRAQAQQQKEHVQVVKDQYRKVQEIYKRKMEDMQARLHKETKKLEGAERRRKLELEGYGADLQAMRKKAAFYQKYVAKLRKLVEEDEPVAFSDDEGRIDEAADEDDD